jgi:CBS domain-containing protein
MQVQDIMTTNPACCEAGDSLRVVANMMIDYDCGEIPVVDDRSECIPIGVVTDRDIVCRTIAKGLNPLEMTAGDVMSSPLISVSPETTLDDCYRVMEEDQIRRIPVVDAAGKCVGIVSLADIARNVSRADSGEVLQEVSAATVSASNVG